MINTTFKKLALLGMAITALGLDSAWAQYQITTTGTAVIEDFSGLGVTGGAVGTGSINFNAALGNTNATQRASAWTFNGINSSFFVNNGVNGTDNGANASGGIRVYASNNTTADRALGFLGTGSGASANGNIVGQFLNGTSTTVTSIVLGYTAEWWDQGGTRPSVLTVQYTIGSAAGTYTSINTFDYNVNSLINATNGARNGDAATNRTVFATVNLPVTLNAGESLWVKWFYNGNANGTGAGAKQGYGLDDVTVTFNSTAAGSISSWTGGSPGSWATTGTGGSGNWADGSGAWDATKTAAFGGTAGTVTVTTVTSSNGITFSTTGYTVQSGTISLSGTNLAANTITTDPAVSATISSTLIGINGFTKAGTGSLVLSGANTYSGITAITLGELEIQNSSALGATGAGNGTTVTSGAALNLSNNISVGAEDLTLNGSGVSNGGALRSLSGTNTYGGAITLASASRINADAGTLTLNSATAISGPFGLTLGGAGNITVDSGIASSVTSLTKDGAGKVTLNGANAFTGATTISTGTLALGSSATLASTNVSVSSGATLDLTALASGFSVVSGGTFSGAGTVTTASGQSLTVGSGATIVPGTSSTSANLTLSGLTFASGGTYAFTIGNVVGTPGTNWDLLSVLSNFDITATSGSKFNITIGGNSGNPTGFSNTSSYSWDILTLSSGSITGFSADKFAFTNNLAGSNGTFSLSSSGTSLTLNYAAGTVLPVLWSSAGGSAWLTAGNWTGSTLPTGTDVAQFGANPTPGTSVGINMGNATNNGTNNEAVGAIEVTSARSLALTINDSSGSVAGILTLNGATVNSVANVVLRNNSGSLLTITNGASTATLGVALANTTNNVVLIDGAGGITINSIISGANKNLTLSGSGSGILTLAGANTYTGTTTIASGTLQLGNASGLGASTNGLVINAGKLDLAGNSVTVGTLSGSSSGLITSAAAATFTANVASGTSSFAGSITGSTAFTKSGAGTQVLSGNSSYTGATSVTAGTLIINGSNSASAVTVSGGVLGGSGTVGALTVQTGGTLAPGNSPGIINTGDFSLNSGAVLAMELTGSNATPVAGTNYDQVNVNGTVSLGGTLSLTLLGGYTHVLNSLFFIINNDAGDILSTTFAGLAQNSVIDLGGGNQFKIGYTGDATANSGVGSFTGGNDVVLQAIPEPQTWALVGVGLAFSLWRMRGHRRKV